jgi:hypothetical protein
MKGLLGACLLFGQRTVDHDLTRMKINDHVIRLRVNIGRRQSFPLVPLDELFGILLVVYGCLQIAHHQRGTIAFRTSDQVDQQALCLGITLSRKPEFAAEVTPERLLNPDQEPQNWLMNHRTYDGQRFSPLARINKDNVKGLRLAYAVPLGGGAGNEWIQATPLAENGFL